MATRKHFVLGSLVSLMSLMTLTTLGDAIDDLRAQAAKSQTRYQLASKTIHAATNRTDIVTRPAAWSLRDRMNAWAENAKTNIELRVDAEYKRDLAEKAAAAAEVLRAAAEERAEKAEARTAALREYLVTKRDEAKLATTKAIYQAIIDKLDELLTKLEEL